MLQCVAMCITCALQHCNTRTATHINKQRHTERKYAQECVAVCCSMQDTAHCNTNTATHSNTLQHIERKHVQECVAVCCSMQHTAHCNTLHVATHTLQHTATHCNTLRESTRKSVPPRARSRGDGCGKCVRGGGGLEAAATHCNTLQHTAQHCNILHHTATPCNTLQHTTTRISLVFVLCSVCVGGRTLMPEQHTATQTATKCDILQYTATHCNTLQHLDAVTKFGSLNVLKVIVICKTRTRNTSTASRCYRVFQCGAVCCSVLQCVAMCWYSQCQI